MRIDYSDPKKSCSSTQPPQNRPRKESSGGTLILVIIVGILSLGIGFGSGWMLSQRSAKKAFKAAMEQQSLENSPQKAAAQPIHQLPAVPPLQPAATTQTPSSDGTAPQAVATDGAQKTGDPPLSFYRTLPSGQKSTVLGSGINTKDDKPARQTLQAAIPTNLTRPAIPQKEDDVQKPPVQTSPAKQVTRPDSNGFTVQVSSFSLKTEAEALRSKLAAKGYNVNIVESHLGDKGTWYRVRVGKRLDPEAAKELAGKLGKGAIAIPDRD